MKHGKKYVEAAKLIDRSKVYEAEEAVALVKKSATAKFDETVELHIRTGCDSRHADQQIRGAVVLPAGTGKDVRVLVFAKGAKADEAAAAGADFVGGEELIPKIQKEGWLDFDVVVATPDMMKDVGRLGPILGRRGLMPNPKTHTVTFDIKEALAELNKGRVEFRADKTGVVHLAIGKVNMDAEKIAENAQATLDEIMRKKPVDAKGEFVLSVALSSTMGPGVHVDFKALQSK